MAVTVVSGMVTEVTLLIQKTNNLRKNYKYINRAGGRSKTGLKESPQRRSTIWSHLRKVGARTIARSRMTSKNGPWVCKLSEILESWDRWESRPTWEFPSVETGSASFDLNLWIQTPDYPSRSDWGSLSWFQSFEEQTWSAPGSSRPRKKCP